MQTYRIYGERPYERHSRGFVHVYSLKFAKPLDDEALQHIAKLWTLALKPNHFWEAPSEIHDRHGWTFSDDIGVFAIEPDWGHPMRLYYETLMHFFEGVHSHVGLIDVVHHTAPDNPGKRTERDKESLNACPPAPGKTPATACTAYARPPGAGPEPVYRHDFFLMCLKTQDATIVRALRTADDGNVGLETRPASRTPKQIHPAWWDEPHPFLPTDKLFPTAIRAAWTTGGVVYDRDGVRTSADHAEPYRSFQVDVWHARQAGNQIEYSTRAGGWYFDADTGQCVDYIGRDIGSDEVLGAARIPGGCLLMFQRNATLLRLYREVGVAMGETARATVRGQTLDLLFDGRVALTHGIGGLSLFAIHGNELKELFKLNTEVIGLVGEVVGDGGLEIRVAGAGGHCEYALTGIEEALAALGPAPKDEQPKGIHTFAVLNPIPAAAALDKVYSPSRRDAFSYGRHTDDRETFILQRDGEEPQTIQLSFNSEVAKVNEQGRLFATDASGSELFVWDGDEKVSIFKVKPKKSITNIFPIGRVVYVWEERPYLIHRLEETDDGWLVTHKCKPGAKTQACYGTESTIVVTPYNGETKVKIQVFGLPESKRKKTLEKLCDLDEAFSYGTVWQGAIYLLRYWDKERAWELRGVS